MRFDGGVEHDLLLAEMFRRGGREAPRRVGSVYGSAADDVAGETAADHARRGWGTTSEVWARRGAGGPYDPSAFVFMSGGAAWQEDHPDRPQPTLGPAFDRVARGLEDRIADAIEGML